MEVDDRVDNIILEWRRRRPDLDFSPLEVVSRLLRAAHFLQVKLDEIAAANLVKVMARWATERTEPLCFDATLPEGERLPRRFEVARENVLLQGILLDVDEENGKARSVKRIRMAWEASFRS